MKTASVLKNIPAFTAPKEYLTFIAGKANSTVKLIKNGTPTNIDVFIRKSGVGYWETYTFGTDIQLQNVGDYVEIKGKNPILNTGGSFSADNYYQFVMTGKIYSQGNLFTLYNNIKSLYYNSSYNNACICYQLFKDCTALITPPELPVTTVTNSCYSNMFFGCTSLISAPELPAITLTGSFCYNSMFKGCTSLVKGPSILPAINLTIYCYTDMFNGCTSLVNAPELPATNLEACCYSGMFRGCTSLTTPPELPATTLAHQCYRYMFAGCTNLINAPELLATTLANGCYGNMFNSCTSLTTAPVLSATSLENGCYDWMFASCTSLTTPPELPATTLADYCYSGMFWKCTSLSSAPELPATILAQNCYNGMFYGCGSLINAPELPATTLTGSCYQYMFQGCTSLINAPELPATILAQNCYDTMFSHCRSLSSAPELPASTLVNGCYKSMFNSCNKINKISVGFRQWNENNTSYWNSYVSATGIFIKSYVLPNLYGQHYIPNGWTVINKNQDKLNFVALKDNCSIGLSTSNTQLTTLKYCINDSDKQLDYDYSMITLNKNDSIYFRNTSNIFSTANNIQKFIMNGKFETFGNIYSLINDNQMYDSCFKDLFKGCSGLVNTPKLEYTTLANNCYNSMFKGCTNLTKIYNLPATSLVDNCYKSMFENCTNLSTAPQLPATTLANNCYCNMFQNCINLSSVLVSFTEWNGQNNATTNWLNNVASNGQFYCPSGLIQIRDNSHIPINWIVKNQYKRELSYLQSTGTQWIDTGIIQNTLYKAEFKFLTTQQGGISFQPIIAGTLDDFTFSTYYNINTLFFRIRCSLITNQKIVSTTTPNEIIVEQTKAIINGDVITYSNNKSLGTSTATIKLMQVGGRYSYHKIYYCKLYNENGQLVRDMIPVLDFNNIPCMFDKVTKTLFYNQGTGQFLYG